jgi:hypothetical protein
MSKRKIALKGEIEQCCRYNYSILPRTTIKDVLINNQWLFKDTWRFWSYFSQIADSGLPEGDQNPMMDDTVISFSGEKHNFEDWKDIIDWNIYGTWYAYSFPANIPIIKESILLGTRVEIPVKKGTNYQRIGKEWQFIHQLTPDVFISRKGSGVLVGGLDSYSVWLVNSNMPGK